MSYCPTSALLTAGQGTVQTCYEQHARPAIRLRTYVMHRQRVTERKLTHVFTLPDRNTAVVCTTADLAAKARGAEHIVSLQIQLQMCRQEHQTWTLPNALIGD